MTISLSPLNCDSWTVKGILVSHSNCRTVWRGGVLSPKISLHRQVVSKDGSGKTKMRSLQESFQYPAKSGGALEYWRKHLCLLWLQIEREGDGDKEREYNRQRDKLGTDQAESWSHKLPPPILLCSSLRSVEACLIRLSQGPSLLRPSLWYPGAPGGYGLMWQSLWNGAYLYLWPSCTIRPSHTCESKALGMFIWEFYVSHFEFWQNGHSLKRKYFRLLNHLINLLLFAPTVASLVTHRTFKNSIDIIDHHRDKIKKINLQYFDNILNKLWK